MELNFRALPVGFRFLPTDCEMSNYLLKKKALGQPIKSLLVPEDCHDLFSRHPRTLSGDPKEDHWYYYCRKRKDQVTTNSHNLWIQIGGETNVLDQENNGELVGFKRPFTLIEQEEESNDICLSDEEEFPKYNWFLDEFRLPITVADTDWILCHVFRENITPETESESEEEEEENVVEFAESLDLDREKDEIVLPPPSPSSP